MASSPSASYNKKSPTIKRILREASELASAPSADYHAAPLDSNLFEWHFTVRGPPSTPYATGLYHGRITLPPSYPLRPPSFRFLTPSGRFEVNREICLSISGHHEDTWQPAWGVRTAVVALRAFMAGEAGGQVGGLECSAATRAALAAASAEARCEVCAKTNQEVLAESARAAAEMGDDGESGEVVVPEEMKLGYKTEATGEGQEGEAQVPPQPPPPPQPRRAQLATPTPTPTRDGRAQPPRNPYEATLWVDRAIYALIAILLAVVMKRMLGIQIF
ncbi:ubiquitin-conjugating enzyme/RWD-like protein [Geopyxis carbonaria]|nr:ubiquitin-conjugating enzyme/RWD-like protein [Geopyxis carbonaria]